MAKNTTTLSYRVTFEGKQAKDFALDLKKQMESLGAAVAATRKEIAELEKVGQDTSLKKLELSGLEADLKTVRQQYKKTVTEIKGYNNVLKNLSTAAYNDLTRTSTALTNSLKRAEPGTKRYKELLNQMLRVREEINKRTLSFKDLDASQEKITKMTLAMKDLDALTGEALVEQRKYWEALAKGAEEGSRHQQRYKQNLETIIAEEQRRTEAQRQAVVNDPTKASVEQIKEAIKQTEILRNTKPVDTSAFKDYDKQLSKLKDTLKNAETPARNIVKSADELNEFLAALPSQPLEKLEAVAEALEDQLRELAPDTKEYIDASAGLRRVNARMEVLKDDWKEHDSQILQTVNRLKSYILVYSGWNAISGRLKQIISGNLELSDSLADIQKTTGIAGDSLAFLSRQIDRIDTRSSQEQLHQLAATAGQMGIDSSTEVLGFVNAANQLNVALNELGEDGVQDLAKIAQLTGDVATMGIEKSLLAIGSSINELSANSSASAGPIADFMRRVGGLVPVANLTTSNLAALGATADALGQPIEVAGTAMNKFIMSLVTNTEEISYALNIDLDTMQRLIDSGRTMEAIVMVLEKVKTAGAEGGAALNSIFKELGSDGARMTQVLSAMSQNTEFLKEQVNLSTIAFSEATSATEEYNVKNENAAAIVERIGNTIREIFVNSDNTISITNFLKKILKVVETFTSLSNAGVVLRSVLIAIGVQLGATAMGLNKLWKEIMVTKTGTISLTRAWQRFNLVLKNNAFGLVLAAGFALFNLVTRLGKEQKMLTAHVEELNAALNEEKDALKRLEDRLENVKDKSEERASLIKEINRNYGSYLEYQLSEAAGYEEIASALKLVNEQLDLKYAKMIYEKKMEKATDAYTDATTESSNNIVNGLSKIAGVGDKASSVYKDILLVVKEAARGSSDLIGSFDTKEMSILMDRIRTQVIELRNTTGLDTQYIVDDIRTLYNAQIELNKAKIIAIAEENANVEAESASVAAAQEAFVETQRQRMEELMAMPVSTMTEEQLHNHYKQILDYGEVLMADAQKEFDKKKTNLDAERAKRESGTYGLKKISTEESPVEAWDYEKEIDKALAPMKALETKLAPFIKAYEGDAWGKALNIEGLKQAFGNLQNINTASVDNLVQTYKTLEDAGKKYTSVEVFNSIFNQDAKTIDEMLKYYKDSAEIVKNRLQELGYTTAGNFDWSTKEGRKKAEQEAKRQFEAAKSALKAHFEQQETIIKQSYLNREITHQEMTRRISENEQEQSEAFVDLYSVLLNEAKKYDTNLDEILKGKDLKKLGNFLRAFGPAMVDGMKLGREQSEGAIRDEAIKIREIIEKALLEGDMFGKLETEFRTMLDELSLLTSKFGSEFIAVDESTAKALVSQLTGMADEAYTMTEQELLAEAKKRSKGNETLTAWWSGVDEDQLTLILEKLKTYYDDRLEMQRRYTQRMQREWQQYYKQTGAQAEYEANKQLIEAAKNEPEGYVKGAGDYDSERGIIAAEAALEVEKIDNNIAFLQEKLKARADAINADLLRIIEAEKAVLYAIDPNSEEYASQLALIESLEAKLVDPVKSGDAEAVALNASIAEQTQSMNAIIQQSEIETTNVTLEQWQKRAEAASEWAEMVGETIGDVASLERQANRARLRGDEETARELEAQAEESKQNLVKSALNKAIDMAKVWAMELGFKVMYNSLAQKSDEKLAAASANATVKEVLADILAQGFKGAGKEIGSKGIAGLITGGVIIAAAAGLAAAAKAAVANMFPEAVEGVSDGSTSPKRKLTTDMLTYANGKYPVLGNDGVVYDAQYAGANMKTDVYRKPHFGIFAEKQPEMVIDGKTTQRLVLNYPEVYNGILQLSRTGRMGMRTYNDGNVSEFAAATSAQQQAQMEEMRLTMAATAAAVAALTERLKYPIDAKVDYFGKGGTREAEKRGGRWAKRMRVE